MRMNKQGKVMGKAKASPASSAMKSLMKENFVKNTLPATMVQRMAEAAQASGAEGLASFSSAGSSGWNRKNLCRDLYKATGLDKSPVPFYFFDMELWDKAQGRLQRTSMPVVLPHEVVQWFMAKSPGLDFQSQDVAPWWPHFAKRCASVGVEAKDTVPVAIWVDSVPYTKRHSMFFLTLAFPGSQQSSGASLSCLVLLLERGHHFDYHVLVMS